MLWTFHHEFAEVSMKFSMSIALFLLMCTVAGLSQTDFGFKSAGVKVGYIIPGNIENTIGIGVLADVGRIDIFSLQAYLDYWSKSYTEEMHWDWQWNIISLALVGKYSFQIPGNIKPFVGAGLGFDISSWKSKYTGALSGSDTLMDQTSSESDFDLALHLVGGGSYTFSPQFEGFAEVKYTTGGIDYFGIYIGIYYKLK